MNPDVLQMTNLLEKLIALRQGIKAAPISRGSGTVSNLNGYSHDVTVGGHTPLSTPSLQIRLAAPEPEEIEINQHRHA
jgi:hypothetical protein